MIMASAMKELSSLEYKVTINHRKVMRIDPKLFGIIHSVGTQNFPKKTRMCAYQGVRNVSFPENIGKTLNE